MKISVVITTKDRIDFLERAVLSIINNLRGEFFCDVVIVNDGGVKPDLSYLSIPLSTNLKVINNPVSLGGNKARNQGVLASDGDIIFFLDDDDVYTPEAIPDKLRVFEEYHDVALVYTGVQFVMSDRLDVVIREKKPFNDSAITFERLLACGNLIGPTSSVAVRRSALISAGLFDEQLSAMQDYELWLRIIQHGAVKSDGGVNLIYTIHSSGTQVSSKFEKYISAADYISKKFKNDLEFNQANRAFWAEVYFRVALSCSHASEMLKIRFATKSLYCKPTLKALVLFMPTRLLKIIKPFV